MAGRISAILMFRRQQLEPGNFQRPLIPWDLIPPHRQIFQGEICNTLRQGFFIADYLVYRFDRLGYKKPPRNYPASVSMYDFSTRKNDRISYSGREERLERILVRYIELTDKFYNKEKLVR